MSFHDFDDLVINRPNEWNNRYFEELSIAAHNGLGDCKLRGLCWLLFLGEIGPLGSLSDWCKSIQSKRSMYNALRAEMLPDLTKASDSSDPLQANSSNVWQTYYKSNDLLSDIRTDLERLYPSGLDDFFMRQDRQDILLRVLFVWSTTHPNTSYRQGMHEIVAFVLFVLQRQQVDAKLILPAGHPLHLLSDLNGVECDVFWLFSRIMIDIEVLYSPSATVTSSALSSSSKNSHKKRQQHPNDDDEHVPFVTEFCEKLQSTQLKLVNAKLAAHLASLSISPQLYGIRWSRLLFEREFHYEDSLIVWDHLFATCIRRPSTSSSSDIGCHTRSRQFNSSVSILTAVESFYIALLLFVKDDLLSGDAMSVLSRLMRYPPVSDIGALIQLSNDVASTISRRIAIASAVSNAATTDNRTLTSAHAITSIRAEDELIDNPLNDSLGSGTRRDVPKKSWAKSLLSSSSTTTKPKPVPIESQISLAEVNNISNSDALSPSGSSEDLLTDGMLFDIKRSMKSVVDAASRMKSSAVAAVSTIGDDSYTSNILTSIGLKPAAEVPVDGYNTMLICQLLFDLAGRLEAESKTIEAVMEDVNDWPDTSNKLPSLVNFLSSRHKSLAVLSDDVRRLSHQLREGKSIADFEGSSLSGQSAVTMVNAIANPRTTDAGDHRQVPTNLIAQKGLDDAIGPVHSVEADRPVKKLVSESIQQPTITATVIAAKPTANSIFNDDLILSTSQKKVQPTSVASLIGNTNQSAPKSNFNDLFSEVPQKHSKPLKKETVSLSSGISSPFDNDLQKFLDG